MRSVVYEAAARFSIREMPDPTPGVGEVRIKWTKSDCAEPTYTFITAT